MVDRHIILDSSKTNQASDDFEITFSSPIKLYDKPHEVAMVNCFLWYTWSNISAEYGNNQFRYYNGSVWATVIIPDGNYNIVQLENVIQSLMKSNGDVIITLGVETYNINFLPNFSTIKMYIELTGGFQIDFTVGNIYRIFGFNSSILTASAYGPVNVNITNDVNSMIIHCSLINGGSYSNEISSDVLYSFLPSGPTGSSITLLPFQRSYISIDTVLQFDRIRIRISDQRNRRINLNGEHLTIQLHIRPRNLPLIKQF